MGLGLFAAAATIDVVVVVDSGGVNFQKQQQKPLQNQHNTLKYQ